MKVKGAHYRSIWYDNSDFEVKIIDQRWLPHDFKIVALTNLDEFVVAIRDMWVRGCLLYTSPSPRDGLLSRMPSSA